MAKTVKKAMKKEEVKVAPVVKAVAEVKEEVKAAPVVKAVAEVKEEVKATPVVEAVAEAKEEVKKAPAKKAAAKKTADKEEKAPVKKAAAKKEAVKANVTLQFAEKSYTEETLVNIAKDVWKFDLNQKDADLKTVELYVKPEEGLCYYVFNGDVTGSFVI